MNFYVVFEQHYILQHIVNWFCCVHSSIYNLNKGHFMHKKKEFNQSATREPTMFYF